MSDPEYKHGQYIINFDITQRLEVQEAQGRFKITYNGFVIGEPQSAKIPVSLLRQKPILTESELWHKCSTPQLRQIWEKLALQTMLFDSMHSLLKIVADNSVARNALSIEDHECLNRVLQTLARKELKHASIPEG